MGINVLSLFDGLSCCQIALNRAGISYDNYFASEIDKHAIKVTQLNYPDTVQLGDITKWREWNLPQIDLLVFGSPCQGFSFAGAGLNFDDPRSALFFTAADILDFLKPKFFLMENVRMLKWCERIITERLNIDPIFIDSALVSAQTRKRLYWTNISYYGKPKDKRIFLRDVLESAVDEKYYLSEHKIGKMLEHQKRNKEKGNGFGWSLKNSEQKADCLQTGAGTDAMSNYIVSHNLQPRNGKGNGGKGHLAKTDQKSYCIDTGNGQAVETSLIFKENYIQWDVSGKGYKSQQDRAFYEEGKHSTVGASRTENKVNVLTQGNIRRLTEVEVCRLQTVPDDYFMNKDGSRIISSSQTYKCLGNGMTVDVIAWVLEFMKDGEPRNCGILQKGLF